MAGLRAVGHRRPVHAAVRARHQQHRCVPSLLEDAFRHPAFERRRALRNDRVADRERLCGRRIGARLLINRPVLDADQRLAVAAIEHVDPAGLAGLRDAFADDAVVDLIEQHHRARTVEVPDVVPHLLEMPRIAAVEPQRHDRGAEQVVARPIGAVADRIGTGLAGAEIDEAEIGIDGGRLPDGGAALQIGLRAGGIGIVRRRPGVAAELARPGHGPEAPQLLAARRIERGELAAHAAISARDAGVDHAVVVERRAHDGVAVLPSADGRLPREIAGLGVERHEGAVELAEKHLAVGDRDAAVGPAAAHRGDVLVDARAMLPDERAGLGIERVDVVVAGREIHDAVLHDRRALHRIFGADARAEIDHPGGLEGLDVVAVDLGERGIARVAPVAADGEPLLAGRLAEISLCERQGRQRKRQHDD